MPTYEYVCEKCGHEFEKFQSMKDSALATCPEDVCPKKKWAKGKVKRQLGSGAGLIFKGSGFYITDYRSEGYKSAQKSDTAPAASSSASSSADSAPAAKPAAEAKPSAKPKAETKASPKKAAS
jgi:putative FmdB family regulatory protein